VSIKEGDILLYIIYGADDYSVHHALSEIKKGTGNDISNGMVPK